MATPELAIFDIGATLVTGPPQGPARRIADALGLTAEQRRTLGAALMTTDFGSPAAVSAFVRDELGTTGTEGVVADLWHAQRHEAQPIEGAARALEAAAEQGLKIGVISNIWQPYFEAARAHFGAFFDTHVPPELQVLSYRDGVAKPSPEAFERVLDAAGVASERAVMVGDSYSFDIEPAAALGITTVWTLHRPEKEVRDIVRVLEGRAARPTRTVERIGRVDAELLASLGAR